MNKVIKTAIVGLGNIGFKYALNSNVTTRMNYSTHYQTIKNHPNFELSCVCDSDFKSLHDFQSTTLETVPTYGDFKIMLRKENFDLLVVSTPTKTHLEICDLAIKKDIRLILCEKPISYSYRGSVKLINKAHKKKVLLFFNYFRNFNPSYLELIRKVRKNDFGAIQSFGGSYTKGIFNNGTHLLAILIKLLPKNSYAKGFQENISAAVDPSLDMALGFGKSFGYLHGLNHKFYNIFALDLFMEKCLISMRNDKAYIYWKIQSDKTNTLNANRKEINLDISAGLYSVYSNLYEVYINAKKPLFSDLDALEVVRIASEGLKRPNLS